MADSLQSNQVDVLDPHNFGENASTATLVVASEDQSENTEQNETANDNSSMREEDVYEMDTKADDDDEDISDEKRVNSGEEPEETNNNETYTEAKDDGGDGEDEKEKLRKNLSQSIFGESDDEDSVEDKDREQEEGDNNEEGDQQSGSDMEAKAKRKLKHLAKKGKSKKKSKSKKSSDDGGEPADDDDAGSQSPTKKSKKSKSKKRRSHTPAEDEPQGDAADEYEGPPPSSKSIDMSDWDEAMERLKAGHNRRKKDFTPSDLQIQAAEAFISTMADAAQQDKEANKNNRPAIQKLKLLPEVVEQLSKIYMHKVFINGGVLSALKAWLEPLPDGSLPNLNVREKILAILDTLPVQVEHLKESGMGRAVRLLWQHRQETPANKKLARSLIEKWSRPIFNLSASYADLAEYEEEKARSAPKRSRADDKGPTTDLAKRVHAYIPNKVDMDFLQRPQSKIVEAPKVVKKQKKFDKQLETIKKRPAINIKTSRILKISVEGRNLSM